MINSFIDIVFHFDAYLTAILQQFGSWTCLILFIMIFAETGLVVTPFLPGDSLLFIVGAFSAKGAFNPIIITVTLILAAVIGDSVNYAVGKYLGKHILASKKMRFIRKEHLDRTHLFFEKHGGKTIVLARFVPIIRTFAPFVAGLGEMNYPRFFAYNVLGGALWVSIFVAGGFYFGNIPVIKENLSLVVLVIIVVSLLPAISHMFGPKKSVSQD